MRKNIAKVQREGGVTTLTPLRRSIEPKQAAATAARLIRKNSELFKRLA